jgi:hypothetical protein
MGPPLSGKVQDDSLARISPHNHFCTTAAKRKSDFFLHLVRHTQPDPPKSLQYPTSGANNGGFVGGGRGGGKDSDCTELRGKVCVRTYMWCVSVGSKKCVAPDKVHGDEEDTEPRL